MKRAAPGKGKKMNNRAQFFGGGYCLTLKNRTLDTPFCREIRLGDSGFL